jgi:hypothetical protein
VVLIIKLTGEAQKQVVNIPMLILMMKLFAGDNWAKCGLPILLAGLQWDVGGCAIRNIPGDPMPVSF